MPARSTTACEGQYYHVFNRGALRMTLFFNPKMYDLFLKLLTLYAEKCKISVISLCLMPNHFHLLIRVEKGGSVEQFMQRLCCGYSKKINRFLARTGTIYEGRYHIRRVTSDNYFKALCRYIHNNPVKAALVEHPSFWEYSNYLECLGQRNMIEGLHNSVAEMFGGRRQYEAFVLEGLKSGPIGDAELADDLAEMRAV